MTHNRDIIDSAHVHQVIEMDDGAIIAHAQRKPSAPPAALKLASVEVAVAANDRWDTYFNDAIDDDDKAEAQEDEHREEGQVAGDVFRRFLAACGGGPTIAVVVSCQLLWQAFQVASDFWLSHWTSTVVGTEKDDASYYLGIYGGLCLASVLMVLFRTITVARAGLRASKHLFDGMTTSLLAAPMRFFDATPSGRIINRYGDDVATIDTRLPIYFGTVSAVVAILIASLATSIFVVYIIT